MLCTTENVLIFRINMLALQQMGPLTTSDRHRLLQSNWRWVVFPTLWLQGLLNSELVSWEVFWFSLFRLKWDHMAPYLFIFFRVLSLFCEPSPTSFSGYKSYMTWGVTRHLSSKKKPREAGLGCLCRSQLHHTEKAYGARMCLFQL